MAPSGTDQEISDHIGLLRSGLNRSPETTSAMESLIRFGDPAVEPLIELLGAEFTNLDGEGQPHPDHDRDSLVRGMAAEALGQIGDPRAVPALLRAHVDAALAQDRDLIHRADNAIAQIGSPAKQYCLTSLADQDAHIRITSAVVLDALGWKPPSTEVGARYWAAKGEWAKCVEIGPKAIGPLIDALNEPALPPSVWLDPVKYPMMASQAEESRSNRRQAAARSLAEIGGSRAEKALNAAVGDPDSAVGYAAVSALNRAMIENNARAERDAKKRRRSREKLTSMSDSERMATFFDRAREDAADGDHKSAVLNFTASIEAKPSAPAYFFRGNSRVALNEFADAVDDYTAAVALEPTEAAVYLNRASARIEAQRQQGIEADLQEATADWQKVVKLAPGTEMSEIAKQNIASVRDNMKQAKKLKKQRAKALKSHARDSSEYAISVTEGGRDSTASITMSTEEWKRLKQE